MLCSQRSGSTFSYSERTVLGTDLAQVQLRATWMTALLLANVCANVLLKELSTTVQ